MSDIKVRVGQQNSIKILSSVSGGSVYADNAGNAYNLTGGIANASQLYVSGISSFVGVSSFSSDLYIGQNLNSQNINISGVSTFVGISTFINDLYIGDDLYVNSDIYFNDIIGNNIFLSGFLISPSLSVTEGNFLDLNVFGDTTLSIGNTYGIAYFNASKILSSTISPSGAISITNKILTTDASEVPTWSNVIDGGDY